MLNVVLILSIFLQLIFPFLLGWFIIRRYHSEWKTLGVGALAYLAASFVQIQVVNLLGSSEEIRTTLGGWSPTVSILIFSLVTALVEQAARYGAFWWLRRRNLSWGEGLTISAGYAATESALLGMQVLTSAIFVWQITGSGIASLNLPADQAAQLEKQLADFLAMPIYLPFIWALQRLATMTWQFALGMMVWVAVTRKQLLWLGVAFAWHVMINTLAQNLRYMDALPGTLVLLAVMALNIFILFMLYRRVQDVPAFEYPPEPPRPALERRSLFGGLFGGRPSSPAPKPAPPAEKPAPPERQPQVQRPYKPAGLDKDIKGNKK